MNSGPHHKSLRDDWSVTRDQAYIPLVEAKATIIEALSRFDPALGARAQAILEDPVRANIIEDSDYPHDMMQCRPAGVSLADIKEMDPEMVIPDFAKKYGYGDKFQTQENLGRDAKAIVDFAYRGTPESVTYLAHEVGHAIADDMQQQSGLSFRDFSQPELEAQAYLVQRIFSHYTGQQSPESEALMSHEGQDRLAQEWDRAGQYQEASGFFDQILLSQSATRSSMVAAALGGGLEALPAPSPSGTEMSQP